MVQRKPQAQRGPRGRIVRGCVVLLVAGSCMTGAGISRADSLDDQQQAAQQQADQAKADEDALNAEIAASKNKQATIQQDIDKTTKDLADAQKQLADAQSQVDKTEAQLTADRAQVTAMKKALDDTRKQLGKEMSLVYTLGKESTPLNNLLGAGSFNEFWQKYLTIERISGGEQKLTASAQQQADAMQNKVNETRWVELQQKHDVKVRDDARQTIQNKEDLLQWENQQQQQIQADDAQKLEQAKQAIQQAQDELAAIAAQRAAQHGGGTHGTGQFAWPEIGPISQGYGCTDYSGEPAVWWYISMGWLPEGTPACSPNDYFHSGIDIDPDCGTEVDAADGGTAYVYNEYSGFGYHVIIDHGNGWTSLYGHMSRDPADALVSDGETVVKGQAVGREGSTGNSSGCHLHFQIQQNNFVQNPFDYLP